MLGEQIDAEEVGDLARHAENEAADRCRITVLARLRDQLQRRHHLGGFGRQPAFIHGGFERPCEFGKDRFQRVRARGLMAESLQ
jgi:hypothetical protein